MCGLVPNLVPNLVRVAVSPLSPPQGLEPLHCTGGGATRGGRGVVWESVQRWQMGRSVHQVRGRWVDGGRRSGE